MKRRLLSFYQSVCYEKTTVCHDIHKNIIKLHISFQKKSKLKEKSHQNFENLQIVFWLLIKTKRGRHIRFVMDVEVYYEIVSTNEDNSYNLQ